MADVNARISDYKSMTEFDKKYSSKVMLLLAGLVMVVMYVEGMLTPSLPTIAGDFKVTDAQVSLVLSSYLVGGVALTPIVGKLGDIFGKKRILSIALLVYAAAVSVTGFSPSFEFMVISRTIQGVGLTIMPLGMSLIREEFPRELIPKAQALISAMFGAGFAVSLPLGSFVSNYYSWRMTYHTAIPFVVLLAIFTIVIVKESRFRRPETKIDYFGATLLAAVLAMFVLGLSEGPTWGWYSTSILLMFGSGLVLLFPLIIYELRYTKKGREAILNFKLLSQRNVLVANVSLTISGMGMFLAMQALTFRFTSPVPSGFGESILNTGLSLVPFALGVLIFGPVAGSLVQKTGVKPLAMLGSGISALGFVLQALLPDFTGVLLIEFMTGAGLSLINASMINMIVLTVNPRDMGLATAMNGTFRSMGSSVGAPIAGSLMTTFTASFVIAVIDGNPVTAILPAHIAFSYIFIVAAIAFAIALVIVPFGKEVLGRRNKFKEEVEEGQDK